MTEQKSDISPRQTFRANVLSNTLKLSKKGTPSVNFRFSTEYNIENPDFPVRFTIFGDLYLTPNTIKRSMEILQNVFQWRGKDIQELNDPILAGKTCNIVIEEDHDYKTPDGLPTKKVAFINSTKSRSLSLEDMQNFVTQVQPLIDNLNRPKSQAEEAPLPAAKGSQDDLAQANGAMPLE